MIQRFFSKKNFQEVDYYLERFFQNIGIKSSDVKIKKQIASYSKPYSLLVETKLKDKNIIWSIRHSELKRKVAKQQLEIIFPIENKSWLFLHIFAAANPPTKQNLEAAPILFLEALNTHKIKVQSNHSYFVKEVFNPDFCKKIIALQKFGFELLQVERQKIYLKLPWIPDSYNKIQHLELLFSILQTLATEIEK